MRRAFVDMSQAAAVVVKLHVHPDLRIEVTDGHYRYKSVIRFDADAVGISTEECDAIVEKSGAGRWLHGGEDDESVERDREHA